MNKERCVQCGEDIDEIIPCLGISACFNPVCPNYSLIQIKDMACASPKTKSKGKKK